MEGDSTVQTFGSMVKGFPTFDFFFFLRWHDTSAFINILISLLATSVFSIHHLF
jgi:hypothetical protein